jgi:ADP-heptose:LPS heptosyltransferase
MRAIGFFAGQLGDSVISTVPARSFKLLRPEATLTLGLSKKYAAALPLFYQNPYYDDIHVYDGYDNWPSPLDRDYLTRANYDVVFDPMPKRGANESSWWRTESQVQNACSIYGLPYPDDLQCHLTKWFDVPDYSSYIALNYIGAFYAGYPNAKSYSPERARQLVKMIRAKGYKVIVLGDPMEPALEDTEKKELSYFDSVRTMLGCRALVGIDSGLLWCASAYSHPALACYADSYYGKDRIAAIQPVNPAAKYLSAPTLNEISLDEIEQSMQNMGL